MLVHKFHCMASPCEVQIDTSDPLLATQVSAAVEQEARRIETQYSRYRNDNVVSRINSAKGKAVEVDDETAKILDYAYACFEMSDGLIDITSGILRRIWTFKTSDQPIPTPAKINAILPFIGLQKAKWRRPYFQLPKGMEIDFGGIVKEYAVDRCLELAAAQSKSPCLINFGGDLAANKTARSHSWCVSIEGSDQTILLSQGGLASSGDARRYLKHQGRIYSHILNPLTGWAVESDYVSITVEADSCTAAGVLATLSHLQKDPKLFLEAQAVRFWLVKS